MILLGEAYAFGVLWSFFFNALSMLVLRFKRPGERGFRVPLNVKIGGVEIPVGMGIVFLVLAGSAVSNLFTKELATVAGVVFTGAFMLVFAVTEKTTGKARGGVRHEHLEQFTEESTATLSAAALELDKPLRMLIAIRSPQNLYMLQKSLEEIDPETTDVIVMTAKTSPPGARRTTPSNWIATTASSSRPSCSWPKKSARKSAPSSSPPTTRCSR